MTCVNVIITQLHQVEYNGQQYCRGGYFVLEKSLFNQLAVYTTLLYPLLLSLLIRNAYKVKQLDNE